MSTAIREVLNHTLDLLEAVESPTKTPSSADLVSAVAEAARNSTDVNVKLGMNYLRGEVEVLTEERNAARERANETLETMRLERLKWSTEKWELQKELRDLGQKFRDYKISHPETEADHEMSDDE
jgi:hypothetical protein